MFFLFVFFVVNLRIIYTHGFSKFPKEIFAVQKLRQRFDIYRTRKLLQNKPAPNSFHDLSIK